MISVSYLIELFINYLFDIIIIKFWEEIKKITNWLFEGS